MLNKRLDRESSSNGEAGDNQNFKQLISPMDVPMPEDKLERPIIGGPAK